MWSRSCRANPARTPSDRHSPASCASCWSGRSTRSPDGMREVFVLRDVEGLSTSEVAECLGVSEDVVKTRLSRGRAALRRVMLERTGATTPDAFRFYRPRCDRVVAQVLARIAQPQPSAALLKTRLPVCHHSTRRHSDRQGRIRPEGVVRPCDSSVLSQSSSSSRSRSSCLAWLPRLRQSRPRARLNAGTSSRHEERQGDIPLRHLRRRAAVDRCAADARSPSDGRSGNGAGGRPEGRCRRPACESHRRAASRRGRSRPTRR